MKTHLQINERGLHKFAVCGRCNARFESSRLNQNEAEREINEKFAMHTCKMPETPAENPRKQ
jgi:hypothetical protein